MAAELDQSGLVRMELQGEPLQSRLHRVLETAGVVFALETDDQVSRAGEFHPRALPEPDVRLSPHPAPIVRPRPYSRRQ